MPFGCSLELEEEEEAEVTHNQLGDGEGEGKEHTDWHNYQPLGQLMVDTHFVEMVLMPMGVEVAPHEQLEHWNWNWVRDKIDRVPDGDMPHSLGPFGEEEPASSMASLAEAVGHFAAAGPARGLA